MARNILIVLLFLSCQYVHARQSDSLLLAVVKAIEHADHFDSSRFAQINSLRMVLLQTAPSDLRTRYNLSERLFRAYEVFHYDSAFVYARQTLHLAQRLEDPGAIASARINFGGCGYVQRSPG